MVINKKYIKDPINNNNNNIYNKILFSQKQLYFDAKHQLRKLTISHRVLFSYHFK